MTVGGVTPTGFIQPTQDEIAASIAQYQTSNVNAGLNTNSDQPLGQINQGYAQQLASAWEAMGALYNALDPDAAEDALLQNLAALTGTRPQVATYGTVTLSVTLSEAATIPDGAIVAVVGQPTNQWRIVGGITAASAGTYTVQARATVTGPITANANTITNIVTPVAGWTAATNPAAATPGVAADTNTTLRQKRQAELAGQGSGDLDALVAAVQKVAGVIQAFGYENNSLITDANGLPSKSFRIVVWDGSGLSASNNDIAAAIWKNKPSGILPFGASSGTVVDSQGITRTVAFDRVTQVPIYVSLTTTPGTLTTAQTNAIKAQLVTYSASWEIGQAVVALTFRAAALLVGGTTDVPLFQFDTHATPTNTGNLAMGVLQIPTLVTGNILVNGL